ncbi:MAG: hypothetical protein GY765_01690 [bacterium]|nr:hypothetical protein [bacterium]
MTGMIHLTQSLKGLWKRTAVLALVMFIFHFIFSLVATSATVRQNIVKDMEDVPEVVNKMFGAGFADVLLKYGVIALGYLHPFMMVVLVLYIFIVMSRLLTSEISSGTIGFTLSKSVSRVRLFFNMAVVVYIGLGILCLSAYLSSYSGIRLLHGERLSAAPFVSMAWTLFVLALFLTGYVAIFAAFSDSGRKLYTYAGGLLFFLYLLNLATPLWGPLKIFAPINPFFYYQPISILTGNHMGVGKSVILIAVSISLFSVAACIFRRRDISAG